MKRVVLAAVMGAALLWGGSASAKTGNLTPADQKAFDELRAYCRQYGQGYERAAKIRDAGLPVETFLKKMMDDETVSPQRYKELAALVVYVYERPGVPPDQLRRVKELECVQEFIEKTR